MLRRAAAVAAVTAVLLFAVAAPASAHNTALAHNYPIASTPTEGGTLTEVPETFSVTTNEALLDLAGNGAGFAIEVVDSAGLYYGDGCFTIADATLSTPAALGEPGNYTMKWQLVSEDGHTVSGEIGFTSDATSGISVGSATAPDCNGTNPGGTASTATPEVRPNANLGDVLWIGGAILAVLVAGGVTLLVLGRRTR